MSASATAAATLIGLCAVTRLAQADGEACASAYSRGQEERLAGRLFSARSAFQVCGGAGCPAVVANDCKRWVAEVERDLPTIRVHVSDVRGVAIRDFVLSADGVEIPAAQLSQPIIVEAGPHALRFESPGFQTLVLEVSLRPSDRELPVNAALRAASQASDPPRVPAKPAPPALALTLASVGVAALGTSLYFGLRAHSQYEDLKSTCAPFCSSAQVHSVHQNALLSDLTLLGSALTLGTAFWLYFGEKPDRPAGLALGVEPRPGGAAVRAQLAF